MSETNKVVKGGVKTFFKEIRKESLIAAAIMIVIGVLLILKPDAISTVCKILGAVLIAIGAVFIIIWAISLLTKKTGTGFNLTGGAIFLIPGLLLYFKANVLVGLFVLLIAAALLFDGAEKLQRAVYLLRKHAAAGWVVLAFALFALVFGVLILLDVVSALTFLGVLLIVDALLDLVTIFCFTGKYEPKKKKS